MLEFQHVLEKGAADIKMKIKYFYDLFTTESKWSICSCIC